MNKTAFILVTGASGQLGRRLVRRLISHGYRVRAHYRSVEKAQRWCPPEAEPVFGDLLTPNWLHGAVKGCDIVIHCAAKVSLRPLARSQQAKSDYMYNINVTKDIILAGIKYLTPVVISSVNPILGLIIGIVLGICFRDLLVILIVVIIILSRRLR